ncbi:MAG TPA: bisanhydrobacterioruberin hydratase CruF [Rubricoccaceae bacterium]|nr:bisanhydrobacterioruberin hydratase CruF [Rubricoccaceae bacterium]
MPHASAAPPGTRLAFRAAFGLFLAVIVFSVAGSLLLNAAPAAASAALGWIHAHTGLTMNELIEGSTWTYMALLPLLTFLLYLPQLGPRRSLLFLAWGSAVGAAAELVGTQTGVPFGAYAYGDLLGPKILGHVPWLIPPSWYAMSVVAYDLARRLTRGAWRVVLAGAGLMVLWDVALDPAMSTAFPFWRFEADGVYFGMPLANWAGWFLTSAVIVWGYDRLLGGLRAAAPGATALYAANVLFPVCICLAYGVAWAGVVGLAALAVPLALLRLRRAEEPRGAGRREAVAA